MTPAARDPEERFWEKIERNGPVPEGRPDLGPCWIWTSALHDAGYGMLSINNRAVRAHRFAYLLLVGPIPPNTELDHLCRVRACVNPGHLEPVTHRENTLRGDTIVAAFALRTHCKNGHEYTVTNTGPGPGSSRTCRACRRVNEAKRRELRMVP